MQEATSTCSRLSPVMEVALVQVEMMEVALFQVQQILQVHALTLLGGLMVMVVPVKNTKTMLSV